MTKKSITVEILKKDKAASCPDHITVRQNTTGEFVHLYFDEGTLKKMIYFVHNGIKTKSEIKKVYSVQKGCFQSLSVSEKENTSSSLKPFYYLSMSAVNHNRKILFFDPNLGTALSIKMDMNGKCIPDAYLHNYGADIEIYTRDLKQEIFPIEPMVVQKNLQAVR